MVGKAQGQRDDCDGWEISPGCREYRTARDIEIARPVYAAFPVDDTKLWGIVHAGRAHMVPRPFLLERTGPVPTFDWGVEDHIRDTCACQLFRNNGEGPVEGVLDLRAESPVDPHPVYAKP